MLTCTRCNSEKPETLEFFPPHNKKRNGFDSWCRKCRSTYRSETRRGNYRSMISDNNLFKLIKTTNYCTICGSKDQLVVDHDHKNHKVRGMLCNHCNRGLGHFRDDPELLEFARIYLLSSQSDPEADVYIEKYSSLFCEEISNV